MLPTRAQLEEIIRPVGGALARLSLDVNELTHSETQATFKNTLGNLNVLVGAWANKHLEQVLAGQRDFARWKRDGEDNARLIASAHEEVTTFRKVFGAAAGPVAQVAAWLRDSQGEILKKIDQLADELKRLESRRKAFDQFRISLRDTELPADVKDQLFGAAATAALASYESFRKLVEGLRSVASLLRSGGGSLASNGQGDVVVKPASAAAVATLGYVQLGAVPVIAAGGIVVIATIAKATALAASLWAFFNHLNARLDAEQKRIEADLVAKGKGADLVALKKANAEENKAREGQGWGDQVSTAAKALVGLGLGGAALYVGVKHGPDIMKALRGVGR